jgi:hypothetical protein
MPSFLQSLVPAEATGTYDKVNRGATTLQANGNELDIPVGKVGFARQGTPTNTRALMTLLLPVLLTKVPDFYVPGQFDAELDGLSATADESSARQLKELTLRTVCPTTKVAKAWLNQLDSAVIQRDADSVLRLFAPGVVVHATVRNQDASLSTLDIGRDEFAHSTVAAVKALSKFSQRRLSIQAQLQEPGNCDRIVVRSTVIEQGRQNAKAYRIESMEQYLLENQAGQWVATGASTRQK